MLEIVINVPKEILNFVLYVKMVIIWMQKKEYAIFVILLVNLVASQILKNVLLAI